MIHIDCVAYYTYEVTRALGHTFPHCVDCNLAVSFREVDYYVERPDRKRGERYTLSDIGGYLLPDMGIPEVRRKAIEGDNTWWQD